MIAPRKIKFEAKKKRNARIVDYVDMKLDEADKITEITEERLSHEDIFRNVRSVIQGK